MASRSATKVVVIGGGSSYTPEIVEGLIGRAQELSLREVWLVDIPEGQEKLEIVGELAKRMVAQSGRPFSVDLTTDRREALPGADYVVTQMRVGGMQARIKDERVPLQHGVIGQETTGPGGFAKALRTIPVMLDICRDTEELAPGAWLVNFTNPSGIVTEAVTRHTKTQIIGLCNNAINIERWLASEFEAAPDDVYVEFVGCNHLLWVSRVWVRGTEVTDELLERVAGQGEWPRELIESLRAVPCGYHHYYYMPDEMLAAAQKAKKTRGEEIIAIEKELFELYRDPQLSQKPEALSKRGGSLYSEAAVRLIASIHSDRRDVQCVNTRNRGALSDVPADSVVEVNCLIGADGPRPITVGPLRPELRGLLQQVKAYEELTIQAAVTGDKGAALQALLANPLVPSVGVAKALLDDLLEAHADHLPQFRR
jgi:6-phospho-beta-glucosidase